MCLDVGEKLSCIRDANLTAGAYLLYCINSKFLPFIDPVIFTVIEHLRRSTQKIVIGLYPHIPGMKGVVIYSHMLREALTGCVGDEVVFVYLSILANNIRNQVYITCLP